MRHGASRPNIVTHSAQLGLEKHDIFIRIAHPLPLCSQTISRTRKKLHPMDINSPATSRPSTSRSCPAMSPSPRDMSSTSSPTDQTPIEEVWPIIEINDEDLMLDGKPLRWFHEEAAAAWRDWSERTTSESPPKTDGDRGRQRRQGGMSRAGKA